MGFAYALVALVFLADFFDQPAGDEVLQFLVGAQTKHFFAAGNGTDTITDFASGDRIDLSLIDGIDDYADLTGKILQVGTSTVISFAPGDTVIFENTLASAFSEPMFIFG